MTTSRSTLRDYYRQKRRNLIGSARVKAQQRIRSIVADHPAVEAATVVAAYAAADGEVDLQAWYATTTHEIALPRVAPDKRMTFHRWFPESKLTSNQYGIVEPVSEAPLIPVDSLDVVLMPLVSFDSEGRRLGMGGGYYDRYLAGLGQRPYLLGVAFACQQHTGTLPEEAWDVRLHGVATENGVLEFPSRPEIR